MKMIAGIVMLSIMFQAIESPRRGSFLENESLIKEQALASKSAFFIYQKAGNPLKQSTVILFVAVVFLAKKFIIPFSWENRLDIFLHDTFSSDGIQWNFYRDDPLVGVIWTIIIVTTIGLGIFDFVFSWIPWLRTLNDEPMVRPSARDQHLTSA